MQQSPFIWLGSGRARKRGVDRKGRLLDEAARADLPVPSGGILLDEFYRICLAEGLAELSGDVVVVADPVWLHDVLYQDVRFPRLNKAVAVRSAMAMPLDNAHSDNVARLGIDSNDPVQMAKAVKEVWTAMNRGEADAARDILIMEMVTIQMEGTALSVSEGLDDRITVTKSVPGAEPANFVIDRLRAFQRTSGDMPPFARRLQKLLRGVRRTFGRGDWRIEWADDGEICWLLQVH